MTDSLYNCMGQELRLEVRGYQMEDGYNLYHLNRTLTNIQGILDKAYLAYYPDKSKITEKDRQSYQIKVLSFEDGSLITSMMIFLMAANQATLSFGLPLTPYFIWTLAKQAYEYLTFVLDAFDKGNTVQTHEGDNGKNIIINGDKNIVIFPQALALAKNAYEEIYSLANSVDDHGGIKEICITDNQIDSNPIVFNENSKRLFKAKKRLVDQPTRVAAYIFRLDGYTLTGRLKVIDSTDPQVRPGHDYSFILEEAYILASCKEAFMEKSIITALKEMIFNPSDLKETVNRLKIISVAV